MDTNIPVGSKVYVNSRTIPNKDKAILLVILFIPCILISQTVNNDLWFILNNGRYVLNNGIPHFDPFSLHQNLAYVMQQWLSSVIFWAIYSKLGLAGLSMLIIAAYVAITWFVFSICMLISENNLFTAFAVTLFSSIFTSLYMVQRPFIFFLLIVTIELYLLESYIRRKNAGYLVPLPLLSALMVNLQAAMWPVLFIILLPYIVDSFNFKILFLKGEGFPKKAFYLAIAGMIAAGLLNPYGIDAMTYLFRSIGYNAINQHVNEMLPPDINNPIGMMIFLVIGLVISAYLLYRKSDTKLRYVLLTIGIMIMTLSSIRSFSLFCICGIVPLAYYFRNVSIKEGRFVEKGSRAVLLMRRILIVFVCVLIFLCLYMKYRDAQRQTQEYLLPAAIDYLQKNTDTKKIILYTGFDDGSYVEFRGLKPYIDVRAEVFVKKNNKKEDIIEEYVSLQAGITYYRKILDKYKFTHLLVSKSDILESYLPYDNEYKLVYSNKDYSIYEKL